MRNEDQSDPLPTEIVDHLKELGCLFVRKGRSRLVHDDELGVTGDRLCNLDELLHPNAEGARGDSRIDFDADPPEDRLGRAVHRAPVVESNASLLLASEVNVLSNRGVGNEAELLVNDANAG